MGRFPSGWTWLTWRNSEPHFTTNPCPFSRPTTEPVSDDALAPEKVLIALALRTLTRGDFSAPDTKVNAPGQGLVPRTKLTMFCAGLFQSIFPSSFFKLGA